MKNPKSCFLTTQNMTKKGNRRNWDVSALSFYVWCPFQPCWPSVRVVTAVTWAGSFSAPFLSLSFFFLQFMDLYPSALFFSPHLLSKASPHTMVIVFPLLLALVYAKVFRSAFCTSFLYIQWPSWYLVLFYLIFFRVCSRFLLLLLRNVLNWSFLAHLCQGGFLSDTKSYFIVL